MNVMVVGGGGREHAIAWKLRQSPKVEQIHVAPGNAGTSSLAQNLDISPTDVVGLARAAKEYQVDLTVVGPEAPLDAGIVDHFNSEGLPIFGPTKAATRLESSKIFAKELMTKYRIPCAYGQAFSDTEEARQYLAICQFPVVIKADGLAAGKGVTVAPSRNEALKAVDEAMDAKAFGRAGETIVIEECLVGREVSVFAFTDGRSVSSIVTACDYKRLLERDQGPNTGGMGSYSPCEFLDEALVAEVNSLILSPIIEAMTLEGAPYKGVLYGGLMITDEGPKVLEFNARLGDPETQVILPRLETDLVDIMLAVINGTLSDLDVRWNDDSCVAVVMASEGYPGSYSKGHQITGLDSLDEGVMVFHAGTSHRARSDGSESVIATAGGRVLSVVAQGPSLAEAKSRAYQNVSRIQFQGCHYRTDIAAVPAVAEHGVTR